MSEEKILTYLPSDSSQRCGQRWRKKWLFRGAQQRLCTGSWEKQIWHVEQVLSLSLCLTSHSTHHHPDTEHPPLEDTPTAIPMEVLTLTHIRTLTASPWAVLARAIVDQIPLKATPAVATTTYVTSRHHEQSLPEEIAHPDLCRLLVRVMASPWLRLEGVGCRCPCRWGEEDRFCPV